MTIRYFGPNDKTGVYWPPYTAAERQARDAALYKKPHSGPYVVVYPYARGGGPSLPGRNAALATRLEATTNNPIAAATEKL
jgi:hypothetical protein